MNARFLLKRKFRATGVGLLAALALTFCGVPSAGSWGDGLEQTGLLQEDPAEAAGDETEGADGMSAVVGTQDVESGLSQGTDGGRDASGDHESCGRREHDGGKYDGAGGLGVYFLGR